MRLVGVQTMLDQRLVVLLQASEHARLKELAARRGVSAASLVRAAIGELLVPTSAGAQVCREGSPSYGSGLDEGLVHRLTELAERQRLDAGELLAALLDQHATSRARTGALERLRERWKRGSYEVGEVTWTREDLHER
jgi:predicted DNA-binding ribbon-helix-helix protein